jgi:group II intron reverse transcriptase/maturase
MMFEQGPKTIGITKEQVWEAWKGIKQGGRGVGVDQVTIEMIEQNPRKYLYPVWNRLASGSYFPPPVREVSIPKSNGKERLLGVPTLRDRVAQEVIRKELERELEPLFHPSSYGYRPGKSAKQAIDACTGHCWKMDYVVDVDIKGFFDNIDHGWMMEFLRKHTTKRHILLYCERWLKAPVLKISGELVTERTKGTPQGGVISPLLANLYLHEVIDTWIQETLPGVEFERYADDVVIHTKSMKQSEFVLDKLRKRLKEYGLELSEEKTEIVHCNKPSRKQNTPPDIPVSFDFLGFTFKPRQSKRTDGNIFWGYGPGVSQKNLKRMNAEVKLLHRRVGLSVYELAAILAPKLRGWINYYGSVRKSAMSRFFDRLNIRLARWVACKYKLTSKWASFAWLIRLSKMQPTLFEHWKYGWLP